MLMAVVAASTENVPPPLRVVAIAFGKKVLPTVALLLRKVPLPKRFSLEPAGPVTPPADTYESIAPLLIVILETTRAAPVRFTMPSSLVTKPQPVAEGLTFIVNSPVPSAPAENT